MDGLAHAERIGNSSPPIGPGVDPDTVLRLPQVIPRVVMIVDKPTMRPLVEAIRMRLLYQGVGTRGTTTPSQGRDPALDDTGMIDPVTSRMTKSRIRAGGEVHESLMTVSEMKVPIGTQETPAGVMLRQLDRERRREGRENAAEGRQEIQHSEADLKSEKEAQEASEDSSRPARLAMNEVGSEAEADLLVEPGLLLELSIPVETLDAGLQADEEIPVGAASTIGPHAE
jgi:hypothetical protein